MPDTERLRQIAQQIRDGKAAPSVTVRDFLSWFNALRRGYSIVAGIREALNQVELRTEPDFESAYIDSVITFTLAREVRTDERVEVQGNAQIDLAAAAITAMASAPKSQPSYADPTYRISKLRAANKRPFSVAPDADIREATTIMLTYEFSQLPVMTNEREVKGIISWASIGARSSLGKAGTCVRELMDRPHQEIRFDASLFQAIPIIVRHQYVLIRAPDNRISGIVTASDLSLQFQQLTEPFLLLGEIENHVRRIIGDRFSTEEFLSVRNPGDAEREVRSVVDLSFGEYIRLLENPDRWANLSLLIDRSTFCKQLDIVRSIRNDVMHFDPDGIPSEDLDQLRDFVRFLDRLQSIGVP